MQLMAEPSARERTGTCAWPGCGKEFTYMLRTGRKRQYCDEHCTSARHRAGAKFKVSPRSRGDMLPFEKRLTPEDYPALTPHPTVKPVSPSEFLTVPGRALWHTKAAGFNAFVDGKVYHGDSLDAVIQEALK